MSISRCYKTIRQVKEATYLISPVSHLVCTCSVSSICWRLSSKHETHLPYNGNVHEPMFTWKFFRSDSNENSKIRRTKCENLMRFRWIAMRHILTHCKFHAEWNEYTETQTNKQAIERKNKCTSRQNAPGWNWTRTLIKVNQCYCGWNLIQFDLLFMIVFSLVWLYCSITIPQHVLLS